MATIFYSWQSDLPNATNRTLIQKCLKAAVLAINNPNLEIEIKVDQDTQGLSGSPDIAQSLFEKIDNSEIFVCDISIINFDQGKRKIPNPNVLIELGYAAKALGWENVICIYNTAFGAIEDLPFDIKQRRILTYSLSEGEDKNSTKKTLENSLKSSINRILDAGEPKLKRELSTIFNDINPDIIQLVKTGKKAISINVNFLHTSELHKHIRNKHFKKVIEMTPNRNTLGNNTCYNGGLNDIGPGQLDGYDFTFKGEW
ncbi:hypothetical protein [Flavobacterium tructae]|uniref:CD-NTase-associated protein 12/Pycsar effector protein TIR domain-containing protein n=1 Tax=Flavobacterium tructae TaxID=1114873 RepID=A0A1S1J4S5_9FLAO|nr:hypothetical protein [Flavobacterium tructae]OHT45657.1 hypothetical protein BHE19_07440 [Flavobacterium tructae]OXB18316.1 hypothetical protein B0A71_15465 [Flavobacterium tructae]